MDKKSKDIINEEVDVEQAKTVTEEVTEEIAKEASTEESVQETASTKKEKILDFAKAKSKKDKHSEALEKAKQEIDELKVTVQRTQADFMNFKRRTEKEKQDITVFANEKILVELLGVLDNLERALSTFEDKGSSMYSGVEMIKNQISELLKKYEVEEIATDGKFDPNFHHAVMQESGDESDMILEVFQKGYKLKEKVIRPAMVKVSM
ncbi:MAG: nucleotide exchange factor GrpE [Proteocatella sp.]